MDRPESSLRSLRLSQAAESEMVSGKFVVDGDRVRQFAEATNDHNRLYGAGAVPPVFAIVPAFDVMRETIGALVPDDLRRWIVHRSHDIGIHHPLQVGMRLVTASGLHASRVRKSGTAFTLRLMTTDETGALVVEQISSFLIRNFWDAEDWGPEGPNYGSIDPSVPPREVRVRVDVDQPERYASASGDWAKIHLSDAYATGLGLPGRIVHGMCTMALCSTAMVAEVAGDDPRRVRRMAVQFSGMVRPGDELSLSTYSVSANGEGASFGFDACVDGRRVIRNGWVEIAAP
jgi:acyl dehydratase